MDDTPKVGHRVAVFHWNFIYNPGSEPEEVHGLWFGNTRPGPIPEAWGLPCSGQVFSCLCPDWCSGCVGPLHSPRRGLPLEDAAEVRPERPLPWARFVLVSILPPCPGMPGSFLKPSCLQAAQGPPSVSTRDAHPGQCLCSSDLLDLFSHWNWPIGSSNSATS